MINRKRRTATYALQNLYHTIKMFFVKTLLCYVASYFKTVHLLVLQLIYDSIGVVSLYRIYFFHFSCFQVFSIAHALTTTPEALSIATSLTLKEFKDDGCCYIELRSTPRDTPYMNKRQYIESIVMAME